MKNRTYKILLLSDLKSTSKKILENTAGLAKMINGEIEIVYIKKPSDVVKVDNQLSAMRSINTEHMATDKKIIQLVASISKTHGIDIRYSFAFGNVRNEIGRYIEERTPDIVVLGRRKSKPINLLGDGITAFVLNRFNGFIMIFSPKRTLDPGKELSLGVLNELERSFETEVAMDLMAHARKPIKSFKFVKNSVARKKKQFPSDTGTIEYAFEYNEGNVNNFSRYLMKNNIDLLYVDRGVKDSDNNTNLKNSDLKNIMKKIKIPLLISAK